MSSSVKCWNKAQCIRVIENNYLGQPDKKGKQKDYYDQREEINARLWATQDKEAEKELKEHIATPDWVFEGVTMTGIKPEEATDRLKGFIKAGKAIDQVEKKEALKLNTVKVFNKWRFIANECANRVNA